MAQRKKATISSQPSSQRRHQRLPLGYTIGQPLAQALRHVITDRPSDPVQHTADCLYQAEATTLPRHRTRRFLSEASSAVEEMRRVKKERQKELNDVTTKVSQLTVMMGQNPRGLPPK